ncbi:hypothetical protein SSS_04311 [Sarcoptes scabiei]|nr:hypothetical protein SSS_04311 [Sarcoptes scabiei]
MMISKRSGNDVDSRCSFDCFKSILVLVFAILFGILSLFSLLCLPDFIEKQLISTFILGPKSSTFSGWQKPNIPIYNYYYLFNITNADEIFRDGAKPDLQQLGPYVYRQSMEKTNISWNFANNTVQYRQVKSWFFDPTKSNGSLDDEIVHLNVPLISAIHKINLMPEEERFIAQESLNSMIESFSLATVMRHKISELLFDGYEDDLLKTASTLQPTEMQQARFSYLYGKNNTSTDGLFRIHTGGSDSAKSLGLMDTWNNENIISQWPSGEKCRSFNKSTAGDLLPPFYLEQNYRLMRYLGKQPILEPNPAIRMFIGEMCRSFELEFVEKFTKNQLRGYRYGLSTKSFDYTVDDNQCFCVEQKSVLQSYSCYPIQSNLDMNSEFFLTVAHLTAYMV